MRKDARSRILLETDQFLEGGAPLSAIPTGRRVAPDEVTEAVDYFLSFSAAAVTGQCLGVNGGLST
jgi:NAD(P)-dependent dehydrogenase (short-subunit alcohol dehydrogenase family)